MDGKTKNTGNRPLCSFDINRDKTFKAIKDKYYMCYSEESLKDINCLSKKVVEHFCRN